MNMVQARPVGASDALFEQRIEEFKEFKEKHHHCDLGASSKEYKSLGIWCKNTRSAYNGKGTMKITKDRIRRLEAIGFKWSLRKSKKKNTAVVDQECTLNL